MELRGCPYGRASTRECLEKYPLEFVSDVAHGMPKDPNHPERAYYAGGAGWNGHEFAFEFKLPEDLVGQEVLLQWRYISANSCSPPDYHAYFSGNNAEGVELPDEYWNGSVPPCAAIPDDGNQAVAASP